MANNSESHCQHATTITLNIIVANVVCFSVKESEKARENVCYSVSDVPSVVDVLQFRLRRKKIKMMHVLNHVTIWYHDFTWFPFLMIYRLCRFGG